jgi:hypothetical protein
MSCEICRLVDGHRGFGGMSAASIFRAEEQSAYIQGLLFYHANCEIKSSPETYVKSCMTSHHRQDCIVDRIKMEASKCFGWSAKILNASVLLVFGPLK